MSRSRLEQRNLSISRRRLLGAAPAAAGAFALAHHPLSARMLAPSGQAVQRVDELVIDLTSEPATLDPATTYEVNGFSIVHAVYDSLMQYGLNGEIELLLAESVTNPDPTTVEIKLRGDVTFHNGEAFDSASVAYSLAHIVAEETASSIAGNFATVSEVQTPDPLTVRLILSAPSPWLPAQMTAWLACVPPVAAAAGDLSRSPVGTGPYRFVEWAAGEHILLEANADYRVDSPKGQAVANRVRFRFVPEASTRVADLLAGTAHIARAVPVDQASVVEDAGASVIVNTVSGTAFVRIPTDVEPFNDPQVRRAMNHAIDRQAIIDALLGGHGVPLPNLFVPNGLGYDANLAAHAYDPELAKSLLADAGYADGFETRIAYAALERGDLVEAIAGQLGEIGINAAVEQVEVATFNQGWKDPEAAPLRYVTWRPVFDPYTLLNLVISNAGFLSRHDNPNVQALIDAAAVETDAEARAALYLELGRALHDEPAGIYLWSATALYGQAAGAPAWTPRPDDYIIPTVR